MRTLRTLCTGGGGFDIGAHQAGYKTVDGFEIEDRIASVARLNNLNVHTADITKVDFNHLQLVDHLHASPSCKTASSANTKGVETAEDRLVAAAICRAIRAHKGQTFSLENVWAYRLYESFEYIEETLKACGFKSEYSHVNAADFGVPQTRRRLILRAVRGVDRVPPLIPTHRQFGDLFSPTWRSWFQAVEDIVHTFPETRPAAWQLQRLAQMPEFNVLISGANSSGLTIRTSKQPAYTVTASMDRAPARAFIVHPTDQRTMPVRASDQPMFTVMAGSGKRPSGSYPRMFLLGVQSARAGEGAAIRDQAEPAMTLRARSENYRVYIGTWRRVTVLGQMRWQTFPDSYIGMTAEINGNAVPPLLATRIMESLRSE